MNKKFLLLPLSILSLTIMAQQKAKPEDTEVWTPVPKMVTPGNNCGAPSDAVILFNGADLNQWVSGY
jgi:hypothetical protein